MGSIWRPYAGTGSRDLDPSVFIQFINGWDPTASKFWSHGLDGISRNVHPT